MRAAATVAGAGHGLWPIGGELPVGQPVGERRVANSTCLGGAGRSPVRGNGLAGK